MSGDTRCVITGATGFIGRNLLRRLVRDHQDVLLLGRTRPLEMPSGVRFHSWNLDAPQLPSSLVDELQGANVFHLAAHAHRRFTGFGDRESFSRKNTEATRVLADAAVEGRARQFIFMSSIGVLGTSSSEHPLSEADAYAPATPYGESKRHAELALKDIAAKAELPITVLRAPLVYGHGAPGNFATLVGAIDAGIPLPFTQINNSRHMLGVDNLADAVALSASSSFSGFRVFHVADDEALSTPQFCRLIGQALGRPCRLFPFPVVGLRAGARLLGRPSLGDALTANLKISNTLIRERLGWRPAKSIEAGLKEYLGEQNVD